MMAPTSCVTEKPAAETGDVDPPALQAPSSNLAQRFAVCNFSVSDYVTGFRPGTRWHQRAHSTCGITGTTICDRLRRSGSAAFDAGSSCRNVVLIQFGRLYFDSEERCQDPVDEGRAEAPERSCNAGGVTVVPLGEGGQAGTFVGPSASTGSLVMAGGMMELATTGLRWCEAGGW